MIRRVISSENVAPKGENVDLAGVREDQETYKGGRLEKKCNFQKKSAHRIVSGTEIYSKQ